MHLKLGVRRHRDACRKNQRRCQNKAGAFRIPRSTNMAWEYWSTCSPMRSPWNCCRADAILSNSPSLFQIVFTAYGFTQATMTTPGTELNGCIDQYLNYLLVEKGLSRATLESYSRDLLNY